MTLTDNEKIAARSLKITDEEMEQRIKRYNNKDFYKVSIIIPVYNGEKYIYSAIQSALKQKYKSFEVIVVNDGSTDSTHDICKQIDGITYIMKYNGGTGSALNAGIRHSKGEWIKWLSADDILDVMALEKMMTYPKLDKDVIYYTHYDYIDEDGHITGEFHEPDRNDKSIEELKQDMMGNFFGNGSTSLIHKDIFKKIGMFDEMKHSEDYEYWLRALSNDVRLELMDCYTLQYRIHDEQLTKKYGGSLNDEIRSKYV